MVLERRRSATRKAQNAKAMKAAPPAKPRRSSSAAVPKTGRRSSSGGRPSSAPSKAYPSKGRRSSVGSAPVSSQARRKSSSARAPPVAKRSAGTKKAPVAPKKAPVAAKKAVIKQALKRPAKANATVAAKAQKRLTKAPAAPVLKRPAGAGNTDAVLKRPARGGKARDEVAKDKAGNDDIDVENLVQAQFHKELLRSPGSMTPDLRYPCPTTPRYAKSPTLPASFASPMFLSPGHFSSVELIATRNERAQTRAQMRAQPPPPPKSWSASNIQEKEVPARKRLTSQPRSPISCRPPSGRNSLSSSLFGNTATGDSLDDLLPSGDQLRLRAEVPGMLYNRAKQRRASASRDLRSQVGLPPSPQRPPASPPRSRGRTSFGAPPFESSPTRRRGAAEAQSPPRSLRRASSWAPSPGPCAPDPEVMEAAGTRIGEAMMVAARILSVRKERFASKVEWAFAVLGKPQRDLGVVQKVYRTLMRPLHPDRAGTQPEVCAAVDLLREAKDICERALRQQHPPGRPSRLGFTHLCTEPGRRQFRVAWKAPESRESAPVHRYIVAVYDPSYGKALAVGTLEPDYSQEYKRYLSYDDPELCSYVISEEDLRKMPNLFKLDVVTVQVAAGNNEGQSDWSILKVRLHAEATQSKRSRSPGGPVQPTTSVPTPSKRVSIPPSGASSAPGKTSGRASIPGSARVEPYSSAPNPEVDATFERFVDLKNGRELGGWLQHQRKDQIQGWLKKRVQQSSGSKEAMIQRIIHFKENNPW